MQLYPQQAEALDAMEHFIESDDAVFILKGYAGTGKTTIISAFCEALARHDRQPLLMAPTGRAAKILGAKNGRNATTIHKAIYHRSSFKFVEHDENGDPLTHLSADKPQTEVDDIDIFFDIRNITDTCEAAKTVIVVDEASLVSSRPSHAEMIHFGTDNLMDDLLTFAQLSLSCKIVFVGDPAQLPPVGDNRSAALSEEYFRQLDIGVRSFTLTDVVRQKGDSLILANAMKVRHVLDSTVRNALCFDLRKGEVEALTEDEVVTRYTRICPQPRLNQSVIICFSNSQTQLYNQAVRQQYFSDTALHKGDILQVVSNRYSTTPDCETLFNGDFIRLTEEPSPVEFHSIPVWTERIGKKERVPIELQFQDIVYETEKGETGQSKILTSLLYNNRPRLSREESVALYIFFRMCNRTLQRGSREYAQQLMADAYFNALQAKFGYAITGHKAQGGEWDTAIVDYNGRTGLDNDSLRWNYTATTRAARCLLGVHLPHITPFNRFSISAIQTSSKPQAEVICIKDSTCDHLSPTATPSQKAKCNSIAAALAELNCSIQSVTCKPYRDRYTIQGPFGVKAFDCQYNGSGIYTTFSSLHPSNDDTPIMEALRDRRCYEYDSRYTPSIGCLERLRNMVLSAADQTGVKITGIREFPAQYYVLYGLKTTAPYATLQFYFNGKGFVTRALAASAMGDKDELLQQLITCIQQRTCQQ